MPGPGRVACKVAAIGPPCRRTTGLWLNKLRSTTSTCGSTGKVTVRAGQESRTSAVGQILPTTKANCPGDVGGIASARTFAQLDQAVAVYLVIGYGERRGRTADLPLFRERERERERQERSRTPSPPVRRTKPGWGTFAGT
jgi:hypothetical protein